ncbi:hypothetical protein, variant [Aphanomyces invadans]|uniref:Uncharacterized protein n=1 Tax=Aphanomyces invadans TaxID=157072 RepID=A0A024UI15_9STRA|nr:hypothetical protein, variant [Aphanomyces invadans]ETW05894.1 hypothetical protein, variant [Aphanomyces invadans]|eukprot:XP_008865671.1 hypothetical protein, variant [Aphanomyces invadans]
MHTNWHSDDSDGASWMDEQGSEGRSSSLTHQPFLLRPQTEPSHQPKDDITLAIQALQFELEMWNDTYAVSAPYISPSQQDAWKAIVAQVEEVSRQVEGVRMKNGLVAVNDTTASSTTVPARERPRRHNSIVSDAQPESYWAGLWYLLGDVENDRNHRLGVVTERTMPGDAYVLLQIWSCLDSKDFAAVAAVCTDWFRLVYHSKLGQRQWQHMTCHRWPRIREWDSPFVTRVCGASTDWRERFIALHKLDSNWRNGTRVALAAPFALLATPTIRCMHFVDESRLLLLGTSQGSVQRMEIGTIRTDEQLPTSAQQVHNFSISAISSHGTRAVSGSIDGSLCILDLAVPPRASRPLPVGHFDSITSVEMHGDDVVVSSSKDATVRVWDLRTAGRSIVFEDPSRLESVVKATFTPNDSTKFVAFYEVFEDDVQQ